MKWTIAGLMLALAFVAAIFAADQFFPNKSVSQTSEIAASVKPGFQGAKRIGAWTLICPKGAAGDQQQPTIPFALTPQSRSRQSLSSQLGRCHTTLGLANRQNPRQAIMAVNFRLTGRMQLLTMILRFPPMAKKGEWVGVRLPKSAFRVPIVDCNARECLALGGLADQWKTQLFAAQTATFVFPAGPAGKRPAFRLPLVGLGDAIAAMKRAES